MQSCRYSACRAFTLVEVVASLLLVGTLLVAVLTAHRRVARQTLLAQQRLAAIEALDELLSNDQDDVDPFVKLRGKVPGQNPFTWRTTLRNDREATQLGAVVVVVELLDERDAERVLATVDLVLPGAHFHGQP